MGTSRMNGNRLLKARWLAAVALSAVGLFAIVRGADPQPTPNHVASFMRLKLDHAQKILEGIVLEDYDKIDKEAQRLSLLSQAATWQVLQTPEYLQHSGEFRRTANAVSAAAKDKNLDGAALAYMEMTMKCVNCHKYVRDTRLTFAAP